MAINGTITTRKFKMKLKNILRASALSIALAATIPAFAMQSTLSISTITGNYGAINGQSNEITSSVTKQYDSSKTGDGLTTSSISTDYGLSTSSSSYSGTESFGGSSISYTNGLFTLTSQALTSTTNLTDMTGVSNSIDVTKSLSVTADNAVGANDLASGHYLLAGDSTQETSSTDISTSSSSYTGGGETISTSTFSSSLE